MKNTVQLITYADRLGDGTIASMTDILRTRFNGVYDGVISCRSSPRLTARTPASTRSTTPRSTRASARGMTSPNSPQPTTSWSTPSSTT